MIVFQNKNESFIFLGRFSSDFECINILIFGVEEINQIIFFFIVKTTIIRLMQSVLFVKY